MTEKRQRELALQYVVHVVLQKHPDSVALRVVAEETQRLLPVELRTSASELVNFVNAILGGTLEEKFSRERARDLAFALLKFKLSQTELRLSMNARRRIGNFATNLGISFDEALAFARNIFIELVNEVFAPSKEVFRKKLKVKRRGLAH